MRKLLLLRPFARRAGGLGAPQGPRSRPSGEGLGTREEGWGLGDPSAGVPEEGVGALGSQRSYAMEDRKRGSLGL